MDREISHGIRLGFRLRGQERFIYPGRKNPLFTEQGIQAAIQGNLEAIEAGLKPIVIDRTPYKPFKKRPHDTGFMALYVHYLYVLGKIEKRQYPPRMTPRLRKEIMRFERYREQFAFLRENNIVSQVEVLAQAKALYEEGLSGMEAEFIRYMDAQRFFFCSMLPFSFPFVVTTV